MNSLLITEATAEMTNRRYPYTQKQQLILQTNNRSLTLAITKNCSCIKSGITQKHRRLDTAIEKFGEINTKQLAQAVAIIQLRSTFLKKVIPLGSKCFYPFYLFLLLIWRRIFKSFIVYDQNL
jgi:hypothetical protein